MEKIYTLRGVFRNDFETGLLEEGGRCPKEGDQKSQSNSADVGDVEVVCIMYLPALGERKRARKWKKLHILWIVLDKLPALASDDDERDTETLGVAGGKKSRDETRDGGKANKVFGKLGYQDGF